MADERTPLITVVPTRPHVHDRYPHHRLRSICTTLLTSILCLGIVSVGVVLYLTPVDETNSPSSFASFLPSQLSGKASVPDGWPFNANLEYDALVDVLMKTPSRDRAREWSRYYTAGPHLAGKNLSQALWTRERWEEWGIKSEVVDYDVYINYALGHRLALLEQSGGEKDGVVDGEEEKEWKVKFEASLEEDVLEEDPTSGMENRVPTFHGYSASGNVTGQYVYVNYGTFRDFEDLVEKKVDLEGKIALVKYGGIFRGLKVKRAQELGMVGVVMYSDPGDDGDMTEENGEKAYPEGGARHPSSVQRGSCQFLSFAPGDPTTPGYPSKPGVPRQPVDHAIPSIPSIPISYADALPLLTALNGHGPKAKSFGERWEGGGLRYKGVHYNIGPSPPSLILNLVNEQEYVTTPLWNVIGIINGTIPDEVVILGNHRDAWIAGGAGDPNSGSAAFNEVIRGFGEALSQGWKPLRTIVFASWDGEEYGLIGSTEWVEEYLPWLSSSTVAYLNVDVATRSPWLSASSAPLLNKVLIETLKTIPSPNQTIPGQTVYSVWDKHISTMGSGSDFTAFQDFAGIPSIDIGFGGAGPKTPVYHYHSNYDSFAWMEKYGDPDFAYHEAMAKIWGVLAARLVESPVLQFSAEGYAKGLRGYVDSVKKLAADAGYVTADIFGPLDAAISHFLIASTTHDALAASLQETLERDPIPWWKWWEKVRLYLAVRKVNTKYKLLERKFLFPEGLDERPWFKHVVFAPGKWTGYAGATFPGIVEGIEEGKGEVVERWIAIAALAVDGAAEWLDGEKKM